MKILQIGKFWPVLGGIEKVMFDLTQGLSYKGIECDMLCADADGRSKVIPFNGPGRIITARTAIKAKSTMISLEMVSLLRHIASDYDIIHIHHPDPMAAFALFMSGYKGKVVLHWHSDILRQRFLLKAYLPLQNWLLRRADHVICTSPNYYEGSSALRRVSSKLSCVPIGVRSIVPDPETVAGLHRKTGGRNIVFSLGRLVSYKGFNHLILAARNLPDDCLVVIGGTGPLDSQLHDLVKANNLENKVYMPGQLTEIERDAWLGAASVFCLPSVEKTEAFGIVLIEAMSVGLPVIATEIPGSGTHWVNSHGESGLNVPCGSPEELSNAIIRIINDKEAHKKFSENARRRWKEMFTIEDFIDRISGIYQKLLGEG